MRHFPGKADICGLGAHGSGGNFREVFYKMKVLASTTAGLMALVIAGCANPGIVQLSPDTYMLSRIDKAGMFGNPAAFKAKVIQEANDFAAKQGKVAIPLGLEQTPTYPGHFGSVEYQFRVVDKSDPEARRTSLTPRPDIVVDSTSRITADVNVNTAAKDQKSSDLYTELTKLDDLRKRGIITEEEFNSQKKRLLESK